jgi:hypothetical protein
MIYIYLGNNALPAPAKRSKDHNDLTNLFTRTVVPEQSTKLNAFNSYLGFSESHMDDLLPRSVKCRHVTEVLFRSLLFSYVFKDSGVV